MNRTDREKYLKAKFLEIKRTDTGTYTIEQLYALRDMAKEDVYPDWRFGDNDCIVWQMFH